MPGITNSKTGPGQRPPIDALLPYAGIPSQGHRVEELAGVVVADDAGRHLLLGPYARKESGLVW
jgi:hypothetical protein